MVIPIHKLTDISIDMITTEYSQENINMSYRIHIYTLRVEQ